MAAVLVFLAKAVMAQEARPKAHLQAIREFLEQRVLEVLAQLMGAAQAAEKAQVNLRGQQAQSVLSGPAQLAHSHQLVRGIYK